MGIVDIGLIVIFNVMPGSAFYLHVCILVHFSSIAGLFIASWVV